MRINFPDLCPGWAAEDDALLAYIGDGTKTGIGNQNGFLSIYLG